MGVKSVSNNGGTVKLFPLPGFSLRITSLILRNEAVVNILSGWDKNTCKRNSRVSYNLCRILNGGHSNVTVSCSICDPYNEFYPTSATLWTGQILHKDRTNLTRVGRISVGVFHKYFPYHNGDQTNVDHLL